MAVRKLAPPELQPASFAFTPENEAFADEQIAKYPPGRQASAVIPLLWRAQEQEGWVSKPVIETVPWPAVHLTAAPGPADPDANRRGHRRSGRRRRARHRQPSRGWR